MSETGKNAYLVDELDGKARSVRANRLPSDGLGTAARLPKSLLVGHLDLDSIDGGSKREHSNSGLEHLDCWWWWWVVVGEVDTVWV